MRQANQARCSNSLAQDVQTIEAINAQINQLNDRVLPIVETASGQNLGAEPDKWKSWWTDQLGYAFQASQPATKPTFTDFVDALELVGLARVLRRKGRWSTPPVAPERSKRSRSATAC